MLLIVVIALSELPLIAAITTRMNSSCISSVMPLRRAIVPCEAMQ